jgi:DNA-binding NarL/FixJ family response regulator
MGERCRVDENQPMARTILIVDDHPSFRASARRLLEADGYEVVGEAPDEVAARLTNGGGGPAVVLTSSRDASDVEPYAAASGARGFVPKSELSGNALAALVE